LERISPFTDVDGDGLRDDWENKYFNNLEATADGDPDADGLTNTEEQTLGRIPPSRIPMVTGSPTATRSRPTRPIRSATVTRTATC